MTYFAELLLTLLQLVQVLHAPQASPFPLQSPSALRTPAERLKGSQIADADFRVLSMSCQNAHSHSHRDHRSVLIIFIMFNIGIISRVEIYHHRQLPSTPRQRH